MTPAALLIIATLLPLASFVILVFMGKRMGNPLAGWVATAAIAGSFICSVVALLMWMWVGGASAHELLAFGTSKVRKPINLPLNWLPMGGSWLQVGIYVDSLTIAMFAMVSFVSAAVHVFSLGYMGEDARFPRFFTYLSLFCFSMLGLVIGGTILQLFVFWELVGLCSYLLIGFWYEKKSASDAAIKAFVVNRIGDFGFLIGLGILVYHLGNVALPDVWRLLGAAGTLQPGQSMDLAGQGAISYGLLTIVGVGLFCGAVGKSAQFPLHVWLPDAMEGPTPVSALIHAATMVAAGVYLVGRIFPILTPDAKLVIAIIGTITLTMAALIAIVQSDIKKVLAFSTLSQLGYMILAMGIGSWIGGLFHLITHAFFKALLFLGSGSVIYAAHHEQELPEYGGLLRKIPVTAVTFAIAVLAIAGAPLFAGYYSKDMILAHAGAYAALAGHVGHGGARVLFFVLPACIAYVTAFYMMRCWMLTFWGQPRNHHVYDHAHERPVMFVPLILLAGFSTFISAKWIGAKELLVASTQESTAYVRQLQQSAGQAPRFDGFGTAWPAAPSDESAHASPAEEAHAHGWHLVHTWVFPAFLVGLGLGFGMYLRGYAVAHALMKLAPLRWLHRFLYRRMYFDELYNGLLVAGAVALSRLVGLFDRYVVDGLVNLSAWCVRNLAMLVGLHDRYVVDGAVNGIADLAQDLGAAVRAPQTGRIRFYVTVMLAMVALALAAGVGWAMAR